MAEIIAVGSPRTTIAGDLIFVHGLDGDARETWQIPGRPDTFWPELLALDIANLAVWTIAYDAASTRWRGHGLALVERAVSILAVMDSVELGCRPLVFVTHSLGGLVIKQALRRATEIGSPAAWDRLAKATKGIIFLATPHTGSNVASFTNRVSEFLPFLRPTSLINDLRSDSPQLRDLNIWFRTAAPRLGIHTSVYYETQSTGPTKVVDGGSSDPGLQDAIPIPIDENHISICKPSSRDSMLYRRVRSFVTDAIRPETATVNTRVPLTQSITGEPVPRIVRVFLSCPGDLAVERQRLEEAVRRIAAAFSAYRISVQTWRYDLDAVPQVGSDPQDAINRQIPLGYEVYVGLMCSRFGTPTGRFPSGTVEEFETARASWERDGHPHLLFYFCRNAPPTTVPEEIQQRERVLEFRKRYPGLFASFDSADDLAMQFERHLLRCILGLVLPSESSHRPPKTAGDASLRKPREWALLAAHHIDAANAAWKGLLDYSSGRPTRMVGKIEQLFDCERLLSPAEREVLLAAAYLRTAGVCGGRPTVSAVVRDMGVDLAGSGWEAAVAAGAAPGLISDPFAQVSSDPPVSVQLGSATLRTTLIGALLRIGELLDLDRAGLSFRGRTATPGSAPAVADVEHPASCWAAMLTARANAQGGVVTFKLISPKDEWNRSIRRCTELRLQAEWQHNRLLLFDYGFSLVLAPSEVTFVGGIDPSGIVEVALQKMGDELVSNFVAQHLGEMKPSREMGKLPDVANLLPFPDSAALGEVVVPLLTGNYEHVIIVTALNAKPGISASQQTRFVARAGEDSIVLPGELLSPTGYRWTLFRDYGDGPLPQATGIIRAPVARGTMAGVISDQLRSGDVRSQWLVQAGLWNDWLLEAWDKLSGENPAREMVSLAMEVFSAAYKQCRDAGEIGLVRTDSYRNSINWAVSRL